MATTAPNITSNLTVMSWNARGVGCHDTNNKLYELQNYVNNNEIHVVCIQETNFRSKNKQVQLKGYQEPVRSIEGKKATATGVAIYVKLGTPFTGIKINQDCPIESCATTPLNTCPFVSNVYTLNLQKTLSKTIQFFFNL